MPAARRITSPLADADRPLSLRAWLLANLNADTIPGAEWVNKDQLIFRLPWLHGSSKNWTRNDNRMYLEWARHTGKHDISKKTNPKKWKANFRCAMNSLKDIKVLMAVTSRKGPGACRGYQFTDKNKVDAAYGLLRRRKFRPQGFTMPPSPPSSPSPPPSPISSPASPPCVPEANVHVLPTYYSRACGPDVTYDSDTTASSSSDSEGSRSLMDEDSQWIDEVDCVSEDERTSELKYGETLLLDYFSVDGDEDFLQTPLSESVINTGLEEDSTMWTGVTSEPVPMCNSSYIPTSVLEEEFAASGSSLGNSLIQDPFLESLLASMSMDVGCHMEIGLE